MKHLLILLSLTAVNARNYRRALDNGRCTGIIYEGVHYDQSVLKSDIYFTSHLTTDYTTNTLYLFYDKYLALGMGTINLDTLEFNSAELKDMIATSAAIDIQSKVIYLGTRTGVHKYDIRNNEVNSYAVGNTTIASLFFNKGILFFTELVTNAVYTINKNGVVSLFKDLENTNVLNLHIDKDGDIYFTNGTGLYGQKRGTKDAVYYEGSNSSWIESLAADKNGKVFACLRDGVYAVKQGNRLVKQLPIVYPTSITFDRNNDLIYANISHIVRIGLSKDQDCIDNEF